MIKFLSIFFLFFIFSTNSFSNEIEVNNYSFESSNWYEGKLVLKNGEKLTGLIKYITIGAALGGLQSFNKIYFKKDSNSKKKKYKKNVIDYFMISKASGETTKYTYINIRKKKSVLTRVLIEGKASLYIKVTNELVSQNNGMSPAPIRPIDYFCYVQKEKDEIANGMFMPNVLKSFKKEAEDYFKTCKVLSQKIRNEELGLDDKEEIVNTYNDCF